MRRELLEPVRLSLRKLEERRVLDVSAAFLSATGELEVEITNTEDIATLSNDNGDVSIEDSGNNAIDIEIDGGGPSQVRMSDVRSIVVRGDATPNQRFILDTPIVLRDGFRVEDSIELASVNESITRVDNGGIALDSLDVELGANLEATGLGISFASNVSLTNNVTLTGEDVVFAGMINDDGDGSTGSSLIVNASGLTLFGGEVGGVNPLDSLRTDAAGHSEINADITASGNTITFHDPVMLANSVSLTDTGTTGIRFNDTVDSAADAHHSLTATATNGSITFSGDVGDGAAGDQSLGSLTVTEAANGVIFGDKAGVSQIRSQADINIGSATTIGGVGIQLNGGAANLLTMTTNGGNVRWNGETQLFTDVNVLTNGGNLTLTADAPLDSQPNAIRKLTIDTFRGTVAFNEDIGRTTPLAELDILSAGDVLFGGASVETAGETGPVEVIRSTGPITIVDASSVVFDAGDGNTTFVTTTGDDVFFNASDVELRSNVSIDTGPRDGNVRFTMQGDNGNVDSQSGEQNDLLLNVGEGSVFFDDSVGRNEPLGRLIVDRADGGVALGSTGTVFVPRFEASNGIDIGTGSNVIGGTGIILHNDVVTFLRTDGADIRLNGPLLFDALSGPSVTFDTRSGAGDVIFTNDAPISSTLFGTLNVRAGTGAVRFNEDIAAAGPALHLSVVTEGEIFFGEARTETPGAGAQGPVETINVSDFRIGFDTTSPTRTVFTGSPTRGTTLSTGLTTSILGPVELATGLQLTTATVDADVVFAQDSTINSAAGTTSGLRLDVTGTGAKTYFNADIGGINPLSSLEIATIGHVAFGGTTSSRLSDGVGGPVNLVRTRNGIDIGVGTEAAGTSSLAGAFGIALNGGDNPVALQVNDGDIRLNGALRAQSDVLFDTSMGDGDTLLTSAASLDSDDGPSATTSDERNNVTFDAGDGQISLNANIGENQRLGSLTIERAAGGVEIGGADSDVVGGRGPVSQTLTDGPIAIGSVETIVGGIALNGGGAALAVETSGDNISIDGPVEVRTNITINTETGGGDLNFSSNSTFDSQAGEANDVKITLNQGNATFAAAVGATNPLGELRFMSATDVTLQASVDAARIAQDAGSGTTHFIDSITTTDPTRIGVELIGTNFVFDETVATAGDGRVSVTHFGLLDINDSADMQLEGFFSESGGGSVETSASIVTTGATISFGSSITLTDGNAADVLLDTTGAGNNAGADITFDSTLDGEGDGIEKLTLNAGTSGDIQFGDVIGGVMRLGPLHVVNANDVTADAAIIVNRISQAPGAGTTTFKGTIDTNDVTEVGIDVSAANVNLNNAIQTSGDGRVAISASRMLDIADATDMNLSGSFLQDGGGSVQTAANITTSDDDVTFTDAVVALDDLLFDTGSGFGTVRFEGTIDGATDCQEHLHFSTGAGDVEFVGAVGGQVGLGDVTIADADDVSFESSARINSLRQIAGTGETRFDGPVTVKDAAGVNLATGIVTINAAFDTRTNSGPVLIDVTDDIRINSSLTTGMGTVDLLADDDVSFTVAASVTTNVSTITVVADADAVADSGSGGAVTLADGAVLNAGDANIGIFADEDITLGRLVTTSIVSLTSASGSIVDGGDTGGADIVAYQVALHASAGIGTDNPIDTAVNTLAAKNELGGGVRVENAAGTTLTIGHVGTLSGVSGGPSNAPAKLGGDIEIIHVGAIDVEAPILNDAGGHTTLRAELAGDLTVNQPVQNRGGNGWVFLISGEDLLINHSLSEPQAEISVENEGAIRGIAQRDVLIENGETDYVIVRTHAERSIRETGLTELSPKFADPTHFPPFERSGEEIADPDQFFRDLDEELRTIREEVAPQATNFPNPDVDPMPDDVDPVHETDSRFASHSTPFFTIAGVDQGGSDVDEKGRGIIEIRIGTTSHLERNWHVTVDWDDGTIENYTIPGNPEASLGFFGSSGGPSNITPDGTITARFDSGVDGNVGVYYVHHTFLAPPDPKDPAAPTPIRAELRYDARAEGEEFLDLGLPSDGSSIFNGIQFFRNGSEELVATANDVLTNPGAGVNFFVKVVESIIVPVESRESTEILVTQSTSASSVSTSAHYEFVVATFEGDAFEEYRLFMRVVDNVARSEASEEFGLPLIRLDDPLGLFRERTFPNGHYRIYLEEVRTGRVRLILECHIYEGRVVPPNFREGVGERQPGSDEGINVERVPGAAGLEGDDARNPFIDDAPPPVPNDADGAASPDASILLPLVGVALPWRRRVREAIEANDRPINRARLRLRKLRRNAADK
ncbi:MAG: hypothetical protein CMJ64_18400 [Planctomycetaceae bacterium]|nr:hypothetical protein [Planctomycetaceae bacterium]